MLRRILVILMLFFSALSFAQRIKIDKKQLQFLKNETKIGVQLTFPDDLQIYSRWTEPQFVENMKRKYEKIDAGHGEKWFHEYELSKEETWRNSFLEGINSKLERGSDLRFVSGVEDVNYVLVIEADWIYTGYGGKANIPREEAKLEVTFRFVALSNTTTDLYVTTSPKIIGNYAFGEFGELLRIGECYTKLGYLLALQLKRVLK